MKQSTVPFRRLLATLTLSLGMVAGSITAVADEPTQTIADPGFRPESEYAAGFLDTVGTTKIAVLPTLVRRSERTAHSFASQQQIVAFLNESGIATATAKPRRVDLGPLRRHSQWEIFQWGAELIAEKLGGYETGADYALVMEVLVPDNQAVFGIEIYILDRDGHSAFSFLLNSHHQMFSDAKLFAQGSSEASRAKMIKNATQVGLMALDAQIEQARECIAARAAAAIVKAEEGILHDFQAEPVSATGRYGNPLGFSTFSDGTSTVIISRSDAHPPVPDQSEGNTAMQLSLDVTGWAGVINFLADDPATTWTPQDWSDMDGFSFWLYGNQSGTEMFLDVLDNRSPCSRRDDAERYTYVFLDDVAGWRLISVRFDDMTRKEIRNGAPNDGLNLTEVHGWALGTLNTGGPKTFYIDDFQLWSDRPAGESKPLFVITHPLFVETRLDEHSSRVVFEPDSQQGLVVEKTMNLTCALAQLTNDRAYRYFKTDEQAKLSGGRASFRITFYGSPPEGIPIATQLLGEGTATDADLMNAVLDAEELINVCQMMRR